MGEGGGKRSGGDERLAEGRVVVMGDYFDVSGDVLRHVPVGVVCREEYAIVTDNGQEAADAAGTLQSAVEVKTPDVVGLTV